MYAMFFLLKYCTQSYKSLGNSVEVWDIPGVPKKTPAKCESKLFVIEKIYSQMQLI